MSGFLPALAAAQQADVDATARLARIRAGTPSQAKAAKLPPARPDWLKPFPLRPPSRPSKERRSAALGITSAARRGDIRLNDLPRTQGEALYGLNHVEEALRNAENQKAARRELAQALEHAKKQAKQAAKTQGEQPDAESADEE